MGRLLRAARWLILHPIGPAYIDPITSAASTLGKRGAAARIAKDRAPIRAKAREMNAAMGIVDPRLAA